MSTQAKQFFTFPSTGPYTPFGTSFTPQDIDSIIAEIVAIPSGTAIENSVGTRSGDVFKGRCYSFDGSNDYVELDNSIVLSGAFDIEFTAKIETTGGHLFSHDTSDRIWTSSSAINIRYSSATTRVINHTWDTSTFHEYKISRDSDGNTTLYVDGSSVGVDTSGDTGEMILRLIGGKDFTTSLGFFNGQMYNVKITDNSGGSQSLKYWGKFDEGKGSTAFDSSGNQNHGTITNATLSTFHTTDAGVKYSWQNQVGYSNTSYNAEPVNRVGSFTYDTFIAQGLNGFDATKTNTTSFAGGGYELSHGVEVGDKVTVEFDFTLNSGTSPQLKLQTGFVGSGLANVLSTIPSGSVSHVFTVTTSNSTPVLDFEVNPVTNTCDFEVRNVKITSDQVGDMLQAPRDELETSKDVLGNDLQHSGLVKLNADLVESTCASLDSNNDFIDFSSRVELDNDFDIYFSLDNSSFTNKVIIKADSTNNGYFRFDTTTQANIRINGSGQNMSIDSGLVVGGKEYRLSRRSNVVRLYVDGVENTTTVTMSGTMQIDQITESSLTYDGDIWNWRVYDEGSLVHHLPMSEGAGTEIYDVSGSGNHATAQNITESTFWGTTQDNFHYNITKGFSEATNFLCCTDSLNNSIWAIDGNASKVTRSQVSNTLPDGTTGDVWSVVLDSGQDANLAYFGQSNSSVSTPYTVSVYAKPKGYNYLVLSVGSYAGGYSSIYNLSDGTIGTAPTAANTTAAIEDAGNGWYRCSISTSNTSGLEFLLISASPSNNRSSDHNGTDGVYVYQPMMNSGLSALTFQKNNTTNQLSSGTKIPAQNSTSDVLGNVLSNPPHAFHNNAETKVKLPEAPSLICTDTANFFFNSSGTALAKSFSDFTSDDGRISDYAFYDESETNKLSKLLIFDKVLTGDDLNNVLSHTNNS